MKNIDVLRINSEVETIHNEQRAQKRNIEKLNRRMDEYEKLIAYLEGNRLEVKE